jgi:hypothetical protein
VYRLYTGNLANIQAWTNQKMAGHQGVRVPETIRFNGNGTYNGLEAVLPYNVIGDNSSFTALARRTFTSRPYVNGNDWTFDPLDAARLGAPSDGALSR